MWQLRTEGLCVQYVLSTTPTNSLTELLSHIRLLHAHQPLLCIRCGIGGCQRTFGNFGTYQNHISLYHRREANPTNVASVEGDGDDGGDGVDGGIDEHASDESDSDSDMEGEEGNELEDNGAEDGESQLDPLRNAALFLLKLKESHKLTQVALQGVIEGTTTIWQSQLEAIRTEC